MTESGHFVRRCVWLWRRSSVFVERRKKEIKRESEEMSIWDCHV